MFLRVWLVALSLLTVLVSKLNLKHVLTSMAGCTFFLSLLTVLVSKVNLKHVLTSMAGCTFFANCVGK